MTSSLTNPFVAPAPAPARQKNSWASRQVPQWLTVRAGALLLSLGGRAPHDLMVEIAAQYCAGTRSPTQRMQVAMKPLRDAGVAVRHEDTWYAPSLADLAAWVADAFEYREELGCADDPELPAALRAAAVAA